MLVSRRSGSAAKSMALALGRVLSRPGVAGAVLVGRPGGADEPAEPFFLQDLADAGAVERGSLGGEAGADLVDRQALAAQLDDPRAGFVLAGGALRAWLAGGREQVELAGAVVADQRGHRRAGVAEPGADLGQRALSGEVGAQRLVAAVVRLGGLGEVLPPWPWGRLR
jgi:hypothetical protein